MNSIICAKCGFNFPFYINQYRSRYHACHDNIYTKMENDYNKINIYIANPYINFILDAMPFSKDTLNFAIYLEYSDYPIIEEHLDIDEHEEWVDVFNSKMKEFYNKIKDNAEFF